MNQYKHDNKKKTAKQLDYALILARKINAALGKAVSIDLWKKFSIDDLKLIAADATAKRAFSAEGVGEFFTAVVASTVKTSYTPSAGAWKPKTAEELQAERDAAKAEKAAIARAALQSAQLRDAAKAADQPASRPAARAWSASELEDAEDAGYGHMGVNGFVWYTDKRPSRK